MGKIGRMIEEGDWPHNADLYSMGSAAIGAGYIMDVGNRCAVSMDGEQEITIDSGKVSFGLPAMIDVSSMTITPDMGSEFPRYDLLYLREEQGEVAAEVGKGKDLQLPILPNPLQQNIIPLAVLYWNGEEELEELKDCRTVVDAEHDHSAGEGLALDPAEMEMSVEADEETVTTESGYVEIKNFTISDGFFDEGLTVEGTDLNVDTGVGLGIKEVTDEEGEIIEELLIIEPSEIAADGLKAEEGYLKAQSDEGIHLVSGRVTVDDGDGVILRGTTPDRQIDVYHQTNGGLNFENGEIHVVASDFAGSGLGGSNENLYVREGNGIAVGTQVNLKADRGLSVGSALNVNRESGGGIRLDGNGQLFAEIEDIAGEALYLSTGVLNVDAGYGIETSSTETKMDLLSDGGLQFSGGQVEVVLGQGIGVDTDYGRLLVLPDEVAATGLKESGGDLHMDVGSGLQIVSDEVRTDTKSCITTESGELKVVPGELVDGITLTATDETIWLETDPFFELVKDHEFTLNPGDEEVIVIDETDFPLVSINGTGQSDTNKGEYQWYWQEYPDENAGYQEIVVESPSSSGNETINLRVRIYHIEWEAWME